MRTHRLVATVGVVVCSGAVADNGSLQQQVHVIGRLDNRGIECSCPEHESGDCERGCQFGAEHAGRDVRVGFGHIRRRLQR